ncbi:MAG TPA: response regulator transcription factor [Solirubrobacteraceae bacterium]|jgi:DNA-binding response OmpR family regulator
MPELPRTPPGWRASVGVCDDDDRLRDVLRRALTHEGLNVRGTATGTEAVRAFASEPPDLLILDVGLADRDGHDVCRTLRRRGALFPVLFLSARTELPDRLAAFRAGGDDYLVKPFELAELIVRVHALLRGAGASPGDVRDRGLVLDLASHTALFGGHQIPLTPREFRVLAALAGQRGVPVARSVLCTSGWADPSSVSANALDSCLARIRSKLRRAGAPGAISTVRGFGYVLR